MVRIRTRKPWVLFRLRLFGWKVRFMAVVPARRASTPDGSRLPWAKAQVYTLLAFPVNRTPAAPASELLHSAGPVW